MSGKISDDPDVVVDGTEKVAAVKGGANIAPLISSIATWLAQQTKTLTNKTIDTASNALKVAGVTIGRGQYPGTNTNDAAVAGNIGELIEADVATGSAVALTNNVTTDVTHVDLTPGEWLLFGNVGFFVSGGTTTGTAFVGAIHGTSGNSLPSDAAGGAIASVTATEPVGNAPTLPVGCRVVKLAANATYYLKAYSLFSGSGAAMKAYGHIGAIRIR